MNVVSTLQTKYKDEVTNVCIGIYNLQFISYNAFLNLMKILK